MGTSKATVRRVAFRGHDGVRLAGVLQCPGETGRGAVVLSHCFTCNKDYKILVWLARALLAQGYPVLRFDFAGLRGSGGELGATNLSTDTEDLERHSVMETASQWDKALLVIHGADDRVIPIADAEKLFAAARQPKAFLGLPNGDHPLARDRSQAPLVARVIAGWIELNGGTEP